MSDDAQDKGLEELLARLGAATPQPSADLTRRVMAEARLMQPLAAPVARRGRLARIWPLGGALRAAGAAAAAGLFGFALGLGGLWGAAVADDGGSAELMFLPGGAAMADALLGAGDVTEVGNE